MENIPTVITGSNPLQWKEQLLQGGVEKQQQLESVAKEFEGVLIRQFLDQALKPMDGEGGLFGTESSPMQDQMIKDALANSITKGSSMGLSSVLQAQLMTKGDNSRLENNSNE